MNCFQKIFFLFIHFFIFYYPANGSFWNNLKSDLSTIAQDTKSAVVELGAQATVGAKKVASDLQKVQNEVSELKKKALRVYKKGEDLLLTSNSSLAQMIEVAQKSKKEVEITIDRSKKEIEQLPSKIFAAQNSARLISQEIISTLNALFGEFQKNVQEKSTLLKELLLNKAEQYHQTVAIAAKEAIENKKDMEFTIETAKKNSEGELTAQADTALKEIDTVVASVRQSAQGVLNKYTKQIIEDTAIADLVQTTRVSMVYLLGVLGDILPVARQLNSTVQVIGAKSGSIAGEFTDSSSFDASLGKLTNAKNGVISQFIRQISDFYEQSRGMLLGK